MKCIPGNTPISQKQILRRVEDKWSSELGDTDCDGSVKDVGRKNSNSLWNEERELSPQ